MKKYKNLNGNSGITHYLIGKDFIEIKFRNEAQIYRYSHAHVGQRHLDQMKTLAERGKGLSTYISKNSDVRDRYDRSN